MPYWTEDEARAYLPRLRVLLDAVRRSSELSRLARTNGHGGPSGPRASSSPDHEPGGSGITAADALEEIEVGGIVLRDVDRGIVDFPSLHPSGREVHLCWCRGEDDLGFWHLPDAGFAARRPLPLPPKL